MLSPFLFTHDCAAMHASNSIIKFANDTTVVGLITNNNEIAYRVRGHSECGVRKTSSHSTSTKTMEMIVDFRTQQREHPLFHINGTVVEKV